MSKLTNLPGSCYLALSLIRLYFLSSNRQLDKQRNRDHSCIMVAHFRAQISFKILFFHFAGLQVLWKYTLHPQQLCPITNMDRVILWWQA